jgi:hypothetical protein
MLEPDSAKPKASPKDRPKWNVFKHEVQQLYVHENKTLSETMNAIELRHGFAARFVYLEPSNSYQESRLIFKCSIRTWKSVIKEWGFEKHLPSEVMRFVVTKQEKRLHEDGKDTEFFRGDSMITSERIETFKKRKTTRDLGILSPAPGMY